MTQPAAAAAAGLPDVIPIPFAAAGAGVQVANGDWLLAGWTMVEATGAAPAVIELFDGTSTGGLSLGKRTLAANESITDQLPYLHCQRGLFLNVSAGSVTGTLYLADA
jgi:hypothetical protein